jgi:hypothetical protein
MKPIETYTKHRSSNSKKERDKNCIEYTTKGNRLYHFTVVSKIELEKIRIPTYSYLL